MLKVPITSQFNTRMRQIQSMVELYDNSSTLISTFTGFDNIKSFTIERVGDESKFFGFGVCQKLNIKLIDVYRNLNITTDNYFKVYLTAEMKNLGYSCIGSDFYVSEVHRDEKTNELSITAYDAIYKASKHSVAELDLTSYTILEFAEACAQLIGAKGVELQNIPEEDACFSTFYEKSANYEGTETIRDALNSIAEATQTIFYMDGGGLIQFKRLDKDGEACLIIDKSMYMELESKTNRRLTKITHTTELDDSVSASLDVSGSTQYVRDNPFWDMREDIADLVDNALAAVGGLTINQFSCSWRGDYRLEIGDKIGLTTKYNEKVYAYVLNDVIEFDGGLNEKTEWNYSDNEAETSNNPTSLGEALKQTYAKVDKANKEIELVASKVEENEQSIAAIQIDTGNINASIQQIEKTNKETADALNEDIETLTKKVNASMTSEQVKIEIQTELANGVKKVETNTGFTFDDTGLTVEKSGSEMKTQITEDGMTVFKNDEAVLTANNTGVDAVNLRATTYLIIGTNSRFEDFNGNRTGCFWIGG